MKIAKLAVLCVGLVLAGVLSAISADENGQPGTVNYFTLGQRVRAFAAATKAGYNPSLVEAFQDENFFLTASKGGQTYEVTVLLSGKVYASTPVAPAS